MRRDDDQVRFAGAWALALAAVAMFSIVLGAVFIAAYAGDSGVDPWPGARR